MISRLDNVFASFWHVPLTFLCKLTGKSNFFFARVFIVISFVADVLYTILRFNVLEVLFAILGLLVFTLPTLKATRALESLVETQEVTVELFKNTVVLAWRVPLMLLVPLTLPVSPQGFISFCRISFMVGGMYFATDFHVGGKSLFQRTKEKASKAFEKLRSRLPLPTPVPQGA